MKSLFFWTFFAILLAIGVHIATVVYLPRTAAKENLQKLMSAGQVNKLTLLDSQAKVQKYLGKYGYNMAYAVCPYNVGRGPISISAKMPDSYWSMTVYGDDGQNLYGLNDKQVGADTFFADLKFDTKAGVSINEAKGSGQERIVIRSPYKRGVIIFRGFVKDDAAREKILNIIASTKCGNPAQTAKLAN